MTTQKQCAANCGKTEKDYNPDTDETTRRTDLSTCFRSEKEAEDYIETLKDAK